MTLPAELEAYCVVDLRGLKADAAFWETWREIVGHQTSHLDRQDALVVIRPNGWTSLCSADPTGPRAIGSLNF